MSSLHENENEGAEDEYQVDIVSVVYFVVRMRKTMVYMLLLSLLARLFLLQAAVYVSTYCK